MNDECSECGKTMTCDCGESNQQVIEEYLEDGHDVEFVDTYKRRCVIFKKFKNLFYGVSLDDERTITGFEGKKLEEVTNIKIYKEETNEEKIKRLLEDGKVKFNRGEFTFIISDYYNGMFYGRACSNDRKGVYWCTETGEDTGNINEATNITTYTNE